MAVIASVGSSVHGDPLIRWQPMIEEASTRFGVPVQWIAQVMRIESGGRTEVAGRPIVSSAGALGLMQLMPGTWADMRSRLRLGANPHEPRDNILAGTLYLRLMYDRFGYPGLFGAYNAGSQRYADYVQNGRALPAETRAYSASATNSRRSRDVALSSLGMSALFAGRADALDLLKHSGGSKALLVVEHP